MTELPQELARASAMLDVRRFDEASALLARVVSAEPESSRAWCLMARAHLGAERYTEAISAANRAANTVRGKATSEIKRETKKQQTSMTNAWLSAWTPKPKRKRKSR